MSSSDIPLPLCGIFALLAFIAAAWAFQAVHIFWRVDGWQRSHTVLFCRACAVALVAVGAAFVVISALYLFQILERVGLLG